jgi:hypothetical protein
MNAHVENELSKLRARDAVLLVAIFAPTEQPWRPRHKLGRAFVLRAIAVRHTMKRFETRGFVEPGWRVDHRGVHCEVTELGSEVARAVAAILAVTPRGGPVTNAGVVLQVLFNLRFRP